MESPVRWEPATRRQLRTMGTQTTGTRRHGTPRTAAPAVGSTTRSTKGDNRDTGHERDNTYTTTAVDNKDRTTAEGAGGKEIWPKRRQWHLLGCRSVFLLSHFISSLLTKDLGKNMMTVTTTQHQDDRHNHDMTTSRRRGTASRDDKNETNTLM